MNKSKSGITKQSRNKIIGYSIAITALYLLVFGYLSFRPFEEWAMSPFVDGMLAVFMGAGTIAIITGIILVVQSVIEGERDKKQKVFDQKLTLYTHIIEEMKEFYRIKEGEESQIIDADERTELFFTQLKVALLSRPKTFQSFSKLINSIAEDDGTIKEEASGLLLEFIVDARDDLDVQEEMSPEDQAQFDEAVAIAEKEAEGIRKKGRGTYFVSDDPLQQYLDQFKDRDSETLETTMRLVHDHLENRFSNREGVSFDFTRTGGLACFALGKKRNAKFCYLRFEDCRDSNGALQITVCLYLLKSPDNGYRVPKIDNIVSHQSFHGFEFYTIRLLSTNDFSDQIKSLIETSFQARETGNVTTEKRTKQELRALAIADLDQE